MEKRGQCIVCHTFGQGRDDFLCNNCFTLASFGPLFACQNCGQQSVTPEAISAIETALGMKIDNPGHIIVMSYCAVCIGNKHKKPRIHFELHQVAALKQ